MKNKIARAFVSAGTLLFVLGLIGSVICGVFVPAYENSKMFNWGITLQVGLLSCVQFAVFVGFAQVIELSDRRRRLGQQSLEALSKIQKSMDRVEEAVAGPKPYDDRADKYEFHSLDDLNKEQNTPGA